MQRFVSVPGTSPEDPQGWPRKVAILQNPAKSWPQLVAPFDLAFHLWVVKTCVVKSRFSEPVGFDTLSRKRTTRRYRSIPFSGRASEKHRVLRGSASSFGTRKPHEVGKACFQGLSPQRHPSMDPDQHPGIRMDPDQHPGIRVTQGRRDFWWLTPFKFYFLF